MTRELSNQAVRRLPAEEKKKIHRVWTITEGRSRKTHQGQQLAPRFKNYRREVANETNDRKVAGKAGPRFLGKPKQIRYWSRLFR